MIYIHDESVHIPYTPEEDIQILEQILLCLTEANLKWKEEKGAFLTSLTLFRLYL